MGCRAMLGVWAVLVLAGCSNAGDDDDAVAGVGGSLPPAMSGPIVAGGVSGSTMAPPVTPMAGMGVPMAGNGPVTTAGGGATGVAGMAGMAGMDVMTAGTGAGGSGGSTMMTGGMGGMGGMAGGEAGTMAPPGVKSPCITAGSQVVLIGDSYSNYFLAHTSMATLMTQRATMNMALPAGQS